MALASTITVSVQPVYTSTAEFSSSPRFAPSANLSLSWADGTGASQNNTLFADEGRTISASSNDDLDLSGSLTDKFGATITNARIKMIYIKNVTTTSGYVLRVGAAGSNPMSTLFGATNDYLIIPPDGFLLWGSADATAFAVTGGSADVLRIANPNAGSVTYDIIIIGANA